MGSLTTSKASARHRWHEIYAAGETPRPQYERVLNTLLELPAASRRSLREQMTATLREMGMSFQPAGERQNYAGTWNCDLLPQVFGGAEWDLIVAGFRQRLQAWEAFLTDVYSQRRILRDNVVPVHAVLASGNYHGEARNLPRPRGSFLHLCGLCLARDAGGHPVVKQHFFAQAEGISWMVQNRRALARVAPELFSGFAVQSVAEAATLILEHFQEIANASRDEPRVVLLAPGSALTSPQLSFLARRMGIAMVQGGDLIVLDDRVFLKTVRGLEQVDVIYNCVAHQWLDPLVFRRDSREGVPGLVHCLRKGTVALVNAVGSELADDATLLPFAPKIIRYYLNEDPILGSTPTLWLGDLDQRELALENRGDWRIRRVGYHHSGDDHLVDSEGDADFVARVRREPGRYVAQPRSSEAATLCFGGPRPSECHQDHIVYALRTGSGFAVLPGALTRLHATTGACAQGARWNSKDTWIIPEKDSAYVAPAGPRRGREAHVPSRQVMSRTADSFYWMGRYLERAYHQAYLLSAIGTLETEELNSAERKLYQPVWNRLLPPLEKSAGTSRRAITNWLDRYRLLLLPEPGSVLRTIERTIGNAEAIRDSISPEAWAALNDLQAGFRRVTYDAKITEEVALGVTRRQADLVTRLIPQFLAIASKTMLSDDGWRFCEVGNLLERAVITSNSAVSFTPSLLAEPKEGRSRAEEIELSAFLRLLGTRDAYRRIFQARARPVHVLELLWEHPEAPRSVRFCLSRCREFLQPTIGHAPEGGSEALEAIDDLLYRLPRIDWAELVPTVADEDEELEIAPALTRPAASLEKVQRGLLGDLLGLHTRISDGFFSHQARISGTLQPLLKGF